MKRFSKKRQAILEYLRGTVAHPTAETIYSALKPVYPDLSLATVYRNLSDLKEAGLISSAGFSAGQEHFDANTMPHPHAVCKKCGRIIDVENVKVPTDVVKNIENVTGFLISEISLDFSGICRDCLDKSQSK